MKREELVRYDGEWYDANIVDCLLDEKDAEIEKWKKEFEHDARFISCRMCEERFKKYIDELKAEIESLKAKLESVQASAYADSVDAGMRERRLKRELWLARAERANDRALIFYFNDLETMLDIDGFYYDRRKKKGSKKLTAFLWRLTWLKVERKCRAKAEEYK